jgi:chromosome partitioning protein
MEALRSDFTIKSSDFRKALDVSPPTMSEILKKAGVSLLPEEGKRAGARSMPPEHVRKILEMRGFEYPGRARVIAFMICKGGTGKTTSTFFLSQRLAAYGARVLVIDADPQGNLTAAFALDQYDVEVDSDTPVLVDIFTNEAGIEDVIIKVTPFLHLLPSTPMNSTLDGRIREKFKNPSLPIKNLISALAEQYDYILIDCAPALNLTNTAVVSAANLVVLPINPDNFSMMGLAQTIDEIETIEQDFSVKVEKKIVLTRFDAREFTSLRYLSEVSQTYQKHLCETVIKTSSDVKNVVTKRQDLFSITKSSARSDYDSLAREIMGLQNGLRKKSKKKA